MEERKDDMAHAVFMSVPRFPCHIVQNVNPYTNCFFLFYLPGSSFPSSNLVNLFFMTGFSPLSARLSISTQPEHSLHT